MQLQSAILLQNTAHGEDAIVRRARARIFAVMDGVSGAEGTIASEHLRRVLNTTRARTPRGAVRVLKRAHQELVEAHQGRALTTVTLAVFGDDRVTVCNVGDSPALLVRKGHRAALLLSTPDNDPEHANVLTQAIGAEDPVIHVSTHPFLESDTLLLMSDGISDNIRADTIGQLLEDTPSPRTVIRRLSLLIATRLAHNTGRVYEDFKEDDRALIVVRATPTRTNGATARGTASSGSAA